MTQYIATEWGVAYLRGYTIKERALALIHLAHPDHREWLFEEARKWNIPSEVFDARRNARKRYCEEGVTCSFLDHMLGFRP